MSLRRRGGRRRARRPGGGLGVDPGAPEAATPGLVGGDVLLGWPALPRGPARRGRSQGERTAGAGSAPGSHRARQLAQGRRGDGPASPGGKDLDGCVPGGSARQSAGRAGRRRGPGSRRGRRGRRSGVPLGGAARPLTWATPRRRRRRARLGTRPGGRVEPAKHESTSTRRRVPRHRAPEIEGLGQRGSRVQALRQHAAVSSSAWARKTKARRTPGRVDRRGSRLHSPDPVTTGERDPAEGGPGEGPP